MESVHPEVETETQLLEFEIYISEWQDDPAEICIKRDPYFSYVKLSGPGGSYRRDGENSARISMEQQ